MRITILFTALAIMVLEPTQVAAQELSEQLSDALRHTPGVQRSQRIGALAEQERNLGHATAAIELATLSASEAERSGSAITYAEALLTLARAHRAKGNEEQAIGMAEKATLIAGAGAPSLRVKALLHLAEHYHALGFPQRSLELLAELTAIPAQTDPERILATTMAADILREGKADPRSLAWLTTERSAAVERKDREAQLAVAASLAELYGKAGRTAEAIGMEKEATELAIALGRTSAAAVASNNLGALFHRAEQLPQALEAFARAQVLAEGDDDRLARIRMNHALALADAGGAEAGLALVVTEERNTIALSPSTRMLVYRTQAALALRTGDARGAQDAALKALQLAESLNDLRAQGHACDLLVQVFENRDMPVDAKTYERQGRELEQRIGEQAKQAEMEQKALMIRLNRAEREQADAFSRERQQVLEMERLALDGSNRENLLALTVKDKELEEAAKREAMLASEQALQALQLTEAMLAAERDERTIRELDADRMIQTLNLAKAESERKEQQRALEVLEQQGALAEAEQRRDRIVKRFSIGMAAVAVLSAIWLAWAWASARRKKRTIWQQHQHISRINEELEHKNLNIQSSLNYARTIQAAILPTEGDLALVSPDSFLLYKPLDVVSGDLPFVRRIGDRSFMAAIDCTGHGVPAAMMTFIAYYGLTEILATHGNASSGHILDLLHEHVQRTMEARGEHALYNDGFDIGLCILDHHSGNLSFAGAQLPVIILRNGKAERIKGDVLPLGDDHFDRTAGYRTHQTNLRPNDAIFLFSDGILHQSNGTDQPAKFSMKRMLELLENGHGDDMATVKQRTETLFAEWKGEAPQTDDVLLIGMRYAA